MATVRIYKVAELLGTTSQEVTALLKRDHGIEVKSASSTIEEVVARQFVDRLARQRNIALPGGDIFAETPPSRARRARPRRSRSSRPRRSRCRRRGWSRPRSRRPSWRLPKTKPSSRTTEPAEPLAVEEAPVVEPPCRAVRRSVAPVAEAIVEAPVPSRRSSEAEAPVAAERRRSRRPNPRRLDASSRRRCVSASSKSVRRRRRRRCRRSRRRALCRGPRRRVHRTARRCRRRRGRLAAGAAQAGTPSPSASVAPVPAAGGSAAAGVSDRLAAPTPGGPRPLPSQPVRTQQPGVPPRPGQYPQRPGMPSASADAARLSGQRPAPAPRRDAPPAVGAAASGGAAAGHAHDHARRGHDGEGSRRQARPAREGRPREAADEAADA